VVLSVIGAVQYGTSQVFYKIVPHFDAQEIRHYIHQVMTTFSKRGKEVVMVVDRSGIHRAHKRDATLAHYQGKLRLHCLPAHCGHHLNPIAVCQTQPIKMTRGPRRLCRPTPRRLRGGGKREHAMEVHRFSRHEALADQAVGHGLTVFKRELGQMLAQQWAQGRAIGHDVWPLDALVPRVGYVPAFRGTLVQLRRACLPPCWQLRQVDHRGLIGRK
jgi:hypothetical protein